MSLAVASLLILLTASITSILSKKFKIPYAQLLVLFGVLISLGYNALYTPTKELTGELIISIVLPPLIFQAALTMNYDAFKKVQKTVILLAVVSVAISAVICSLIVVSLTNLSLIAALAFGVIISPTDAAAVVDTLKKVKAPKELGTIVEGEALLNDATALALFSAVSALTLSPVIGAVDIAVEFVGGTIVGLMSGFIANKLLRLLTDKNAQVMVSISAAYGSYILADTLNFSGIVAVAILGLYVGRYYQQLSATESQNELMLGFWNVASFIATTVAFVFIGLASELSFVLRYAPLIGLCFLAAFVARYVSIQTVLVPAAKYVGSIPRSWRNVASLAGVRGAVSVALALSLPEFPFKNTIVAITFGVVCLSLLVQPWLLSHYMSKALK